MTGRESVFSAGFDLHVMKRGGIDALRMLRAGYSPYSDRVRQLQERYFNLTFLACKDAIDHIRELEGADSDVSLLPDVETTPSALEHILERLSEGWVYINV